MACVIGAAAVSGFGVEWRGLGRALLAGERLPAEVPAIAPAEDAGNARSRRLMSRSARLAAVAARKVMAEAVWVDCRDEIGFFFGVGASTGEMDELVPVLAAAISDGAFSLERLGRAGLAACNPLLVFQLMNNFTLCHPAILEGTGGPNGAFFSRGGGTTVALVEAIHALEQGDCDRALCGGADSAVHPVTLAELGREGFTASGLRPAEGAALLALAARAEAPLARIERARVIKARPGSLAAELAEVSRAGPVDLVVLAPWGRPAKDLLVSAARERHPQARIVDLMAGLGDALAATPALAWVAALDLLVQGVARRALVLAAGIDGDLGVVSMRSAA
jgi:hypothetical protein